MKPWTQVFSYILSQQEKIYGKKAFIYYYQLQSISYLTHFQNNTIPTMGILPKRVPSKFSCCQSQILVVTVDSLHLGNGWSFAWFPQRDHPAYQIRYWKPCNMIKYSQLAGYLAHHSFTDNSCYGDKFVPSTKIILISAFANPMLKASLIQCKTLSTRA